MLLAEELKKSNLSVQRDHMKREIKKRISNPETNGNPAFIYVGDIFPEVRAYLDSEGFSAKRCCSAEVIAYTKGLPAYIITPKENLTVDRVDSKLFQYGEAADFNKGKEAHLPGEDFNPGARTFGQLGEGIEPEAECSL